jgi:acetyltransferase-like isoleucine patch superfamily enzyme
MRMNNFYRIAIKWANLFIPDGPYGDKYRGLLYKPFLKECGDNFKVASQAFIFNPAGLSVGDHVYIGFNTYLGEGNITLESEVLIGNSASLTASNHTKKNGSYRFGGFEAKDIVVKKGAWIAGNSSIMAGVTVGEGALVASSAVVTKDVTAHTTVGGVPAKEIKS